MNYYDVEEIGTELIFKAIETQMKTQNGMSVCIKGVIGCTFDNFERFVENRSRKYTRHYTVGISYELAVPEVNGSSDAENNDKNKQEKITGDSETYTTIPSSSPVKSKTGTLEIDFSNE